MRRGKQRWGGTPTEALGLVRDPWLSADNAGARELGNGQVETPRLSRACAAALAPPEAVWRPPTAPCPEVTIIVRTYNDRRDWLEEAVGSALAQADVLVEVIVVDDGSEQPTTPFADPRVGLLRLPYNAGLSAARNEGEAKARGEFVRLLDSDDALPPGALRAQVAELRGHPEAKMVAGRLVLMDDPQAPWWLQEVLFAKWDRDPATLRDILLGDGRTLVPGPSVMWRRGWAPPVPIDFVTGDDSAFYRQALATEPEPAAARWVDEPVLLYRQRADSLSGGKDSTEHRFWHDETARRCAMAEELARYTKLVGDYRRAPLKLAILDWALVSGGAQWALAQTACHLDRRVFDVRFLLGQDTPLADWVRARGIDVRVAPAGTDHQTWAEEQLATDAADVLDVTWAAYLVTQRMRELVPVVCAHAQSTDLSYARLTATAGLWPRFDRIIAVGQDVVHHNPHLAGRSVVIPSPVDGDGLRRASWLRPLVRAALGLPDEALVVLWSGRLNGDRKRTDALRRLVEASDPERVRWLVAGHLPKIDSLAGLRRRWTAWFAQTGAVWLDDVWPMEMPGLYAAADIYLSTSELEGLSLAMIEAMAAGCVPVMTDVGGAREAIDDGLSGRVVPLADGTVDERALAEALEAIVALAPAARQTMARRARHAAVTRFDVRANARRHTLAYLEAAIECHPGFAAQRARQGQAEARTAQVLTDFRLQRGTAQLRTGDGRLIGLTPRDLAEALAPTADEWIGPRCAVPDVSVVIRAHDPRPEWLAEAVQSVLRQEGVSVEVIVVDDGSAEALPLCDDARCGQLRLSCNQGLAAARRAGVSRARGQFVRFLDSDDQLPDGALAAQVTALREHPRAKMVAGPLVLMTGGTWYQNQILSHHWDGHANTLAQAVVDHPKALIPAPAVLWRRAWSPPDVPVDFVTADDTAFYRQALAVELARGNGEALAWVAQPVLCYRQHAGSNSGDETTAHGAFLRAETERRLVYGRRLARHELLARGRKKPVRVVYLDWQLGAGGAQWAVAQVSRQVDRRLVEPIWVLNEDSPIAAWLRAGGVRTVIKPAGIDFPLWVEDQVALLKPDVVNTAWVSDLVSPRVAELVPLRCAHAQSTLLTYARLTADQPVWQRYDRFLAVSQDVLTANPHLRPKAVVIPSPVDCAAAQRAAGSRRLVREALGLQAADRVVLWSGRLAGTEKRGDVLREVISRSARPDVRFLIAGAVDPTVSSASQLAADWRAWAAGRGDVVWLDGLLPTEMPALFAAADFYLSTSELEGMSLALLEAMAAGLYPVVTEVGGVHESIEAGLTGTIVPLVEGQAEPTHLARALTDALALPPQELSHARQRIRRTASRFDVRESARRHALVYLGLDPYDSEDD